MQFKKIFQNTVLLMISLIFAFSIAEVGVRAFFQKFIVQDRYLFWSWPVLEVGSCGAVTFAKNSDIREVAVYDGAVEYDMSYRTNDFGCADNVNYAGVKDLSNGRKGYIFLGDSFGAGSGGYQWISRLREELAASGKTPAVYNFSVPGAGGDHFLRALRMAGESLSFSDIIVLGLTDDLRRTYWTPEVNGGKLYLWDAVSYPVKEDCFREERPVAFIIDGKASSAEIISRAKALKAFGGNFPTSSKWGAKRFLRRSLFLRLLKGQILDKMNKQHTNLGFLQGIRSAFPDARVHFIHLPEKSEVARGKYRVDVGEKIKAFGIDYYPALSKCAWSAGMFHANDGHPNIKGYDNIKECVKKYILGIDG